MSDDNVTRVLQMISAVGAWCGPIILGLVGLWISKKQAAKVKDVKDTLKMVTTETATKLDKIEKTGEKTHTLVNSAMGAVLKRNAELARWKADRDPTEEHVREAVAAENTLRDHEGKQATVDAGRKMPPLPDTHDFNDNPGAWDKPEPRSDT